jgi:hypothetical protein
MKGFKKVLAGLMAVVMIFGVMPVVASSTGIQVFDTAGLIMAINNAVDNVPTTIEVTADFVVSELIIIPTDKDIKITSDSATRTLTRGVTGNLVTVDYDSSLILENIIIDGDGDDVFNDSGGGSLVFVYGGTLEMEVDTILRNNNNLSAGNRGGGGVLVTNSGNFTMNNGIIENNRASWGGGVFVTVNSIFSMTGGEIISNKASYASGGVLANESSTFIMYGGKINENISDVGSNSGINISDDSEIILGGTAKIFDNLYSGNDGIAYNVFLRDGQCIVLGTGANAPTLGMEIGVTVRSWVYSGGVYLISSTTGVFVESGATAEHVQYFFADEDGKKVIHENGQLLIVCEDCEKHPCECMVLCSTCNNNPCECVVFHIPHW